MNPLKEKLLLFTLAAIQFTHIVDFMIIMPLGPQLMRLFEISPQQFSFLVASYTISAGVMGFLGAFIIDRFDRKKALQFCYAGFLIGTLACAFAPGYVMLAIARMVTGAFGGVMGSMILSIVGDVIPLERRAAAMGKVMTAFALASVAGVPIGLYLATLYSWHVPFLALAISGIIVHIAIIYNVPRLNSHIKPDGEREKPMTVITKITSNNNQLRALGLMFFLIVGQFTVIPFISPYMVSNVGFTEKQLPLIYLLGGLASIISLPLIGKLADKYGRLRVFTFGIILSAIPIYFITNLPASPVWVALIITTLFFITMGGRTIPATTMITATVAPQNRGSFMSINSSVQQLSTGLSSYVAGIIVFKSPNGLLMNYQYAGYIAICSSLISLWLARKVKPVEQTVVKVV